MPHLIDLRSDTVTRPTRAMRRAMAEAEVGDDVLGDDLTVIALEERAAELTGKEAGLFVASGTMGNLVSHMAHVSRGGEIVASVGSHVVDHEAGGHAVITGASVRQVPAAPDGQMSLDAIRDARGDADDIHQSPTALVMLENTHSPSMGQPLSAAYIMEVGLVAHDMGVPLHVDGARLWNAVIALDTPAASLLAGADTATFCLSKGLACPVGSVVVGSKDFIARARRARKMVGGGMRQVGVLAAPGLVALSDGPDGMIARLAEDHANARLLADGLADMDGIGDLDPDRVTTNYVVFSIQTRSDLDPLAARAAFMVETARRGVAYIEYTGGRVRALTHYGVERADITHALEVTQDALVAAGISSIGA